ncbi:hypothetical protein MIR68_007111 [Amoeboaphelidium protococcarum]|nr:hypothetical protein MIR68_007111 [Amoeboaphelidium protococcarum]
MTADNTPNAVVSSGYYKPLILLCIGSLLFIIMLMANQLYFGPSSPSAAWFNLKFSPSLNTISRGNGQVKKNVSLTDPVYVQLMTFTSMGEGYAQVFQNCRIDGQPLHCEYLSQSLKSDPEWQERVIGKVYYVAGIGDVDVDYYSNTKIKNKWSVGFNMESATNIEDTYNQDLMNKFDIRMTYRLTSEVPAHYFWNDSRFYRAPLKPFALKKVDAVAFMNRNCGSHPRIDIVQKLISSGVKIDAIGSCLHNTDEFNDLLGQSGESKIEIFSNYKVCIAMENSLNRDYVTEKLWDALAAGCIPIYLGAPNVIRDFLPHPDAIIAAPHMNAFDAFLRDPYENITYEAPFQKSFEDFVKEVQLVLNNETEYDRRQSWRSLPLRERSLGYQKLVNLSTQSNECRLCAELSRRRLQSHIELSQLQSS